MKNTSSSRGRRCGNVDGRRLHGNLRTPAGAVEEAVVEQPDSTEHQGDREDNADDKTGTAVPTAFVNYRIGHLLPP